jgi:putative heme-binding domain-containing protein
MANHSAIHVRFQVAQALAATDDPAATEALITLALRDAGEHWVDTAILTAAEKRAGRILAGLVHRPTPDVSAPSAETSRQPAYLVRELATIVGARGDAEELASLLRTIAQSEHSGAWWQTAALSGLAAGLPRHRGSLGSDSLSALLANPPASLSGAVQPIRALLTRTTALALDHQANLIDRAAAIELLGHQAFDRAADAFHRLLASDQPVAIQRACIEALQRSGNPQAAEIVLERWPSLGPTVRGPALELLLRRSDSTLRMLQAMSAGAMHPGVLDIDHRVQLLQHRDETIRALAEELLGGAVSADRRAVTQQYAAALQLASSAAAGQLVFERSCSKCHRLNGRGYEVGPDISDVGNRSREALLHDILDPNQKVEPRFTDYVVFTHDGRTFNGLMVAETSEAIVLRQGEGKEQTIARNQIDQLSASGKSLMPEGVEKEVSVQQMADLLEFLQAR